MEQNIVDVQIEIDSTEEDLLSIEWIKKVLLKAIEMEAFPLVEVSVVIIDNQEIQKLNKAYRDMDRSTDVLSFPLWEDIEDIGEFKKSGLDRLPLGDIVISLEKAKEQAREYGHSLSRELAFLSIHGFLHLIGYLHDTKENENRMFQRQEQILSEIGLTR